MMVRGWETGTPTHSWWKHGLEKTFLEYYLADFLKCKPHTI